MKKTRVVSIFLLSFLTITGCSNHRMAKQSSHIELSANWQLFSSASTDTDGAIISKNGFSPDEYLPSSVPSTVFHAHVANNVYTDIYLGKNLEKISAEPFKTSWWYRTVFNVEQDFNHYELQFDGINYKANIWLNGTQIADTNIVNNAFKMFRFDVSEHIKDGENTLAVEVYPPKPGDFSIGFVDWNPAPPDLNMGIFRPVYLNTINKVQILEPFVESNFENNDYSVAYQTISLKLKNYTNKEFSGLLNIIVGESEIEKQVSIPAESTIKVILTKDEYEALAVKNPALWWPHTLGEPVLHEAKFSFSQNGEQLCHTELKYGIREIKDYYTEDGHRGFMVNGEKISIRGGGWVDNIMLDNTHKYDEAQLEYVKSMNLNTIRLEGFWGKDSYLYEKCDELGILIMVGWSCHWEWEDYLGKYCDEKYGGILSDSDIKLMSTAWRDQLLWLRNHPSIFAWFSGSDCVPAPKLEQNYMETFMVYDSSRVYLSSAKEWESSDIQTGIKMRGPYAYVPPIYWFADTLYGGAFGFNSETGPGAQVPPLESLKKMIPEKDLWPINDVWDYHCGRKEFNTLDRYTTAIDERYGAANSVEEYAKKAQLLNYELMRPMFEAFSARRYKATGVIQWMLNSAWPELYWQLYDSYLMPNGAFYATKKAGEPLHALYDYSTKSIYLVNDKLANEKDVVVHVQVYNIDSKLIFEKEIKTDILKNTSLEIVEIPEIENLSETYFLDLRVEKDGKELTNNFYWLSTQPDVLDYEAEVPSWYFHTPSKSYSDFKLLNTMNKASVESKMKVEKGEEFMIYTIEVENLSEGIAFFINLSLVDEATGNSILPVFWSDNYISLTPLEKRAVSAKIRNSDVSGKTLQLLVDGINLK